MFVKAKIAGVDSDNRSTKGLIMAGGERITDG